MQENILEYIKSQRVGVLAVEMLDGSPHGATIHFAHTEEPLVFYFETDRNYRKCEPLFGKEKTRASFVIGSDESNMKTLQMDGEASVVAEAEEGLFEKTYFGKFPDKEEHPKDPETVYFKFVPTWWRFTDWKTPDGKKIWTS